MSDFVHPRPPLDWETRAFWEACRRRELRLQRCLSCGSLRHRPRALCPTCLSERVEWVRASGQGTVHTYTVTYQNEAPAFRKALPYVLAYVDLDEGVRMLSHVVGCDPGEVRVGLRVRVEFADVDEEVAIPRFRPA